MSPESPESPELGSLSLARAYIDTIQQSIGSFSGSELLGALQRLECAYGEFPELELDRPRCELLNDLRSAATRMPHQAAVILLVYCIALNPSCSRSVTSLLDKIVESDNWRLLAPILGLLCRSREFPWPAIKPILNFLHQQDRADIIVQVVAAVIGHAKVTDKDSTIEFGDFLIELLSDKYPATTDSYVFAEAVRAARQRLSPPPRGRNEQGSRAALLAMAGRLRGASSSQRSDRRPDVVWPSGRMSFDEFLLQWPCEIELPADLDDAALIEAAYRAILLRAPDATETDQYLRLLQDSVVSRIWIIEDLLASAELRSLERRLRVVWGDQVITEPTSPREKDMPAVIWPWRSAK